MQSRNKNIDYWLSPKLNHKCDVMVRSRYRTVFEKQLKQNKLKPKIIIENVEKKIKQNRFSGIRMRSLNGNSFFSDFQSFDKIQSFLRGIVERNPSIATLVSIGKTHESRDLTAIRIGVQNNNNDNKPMIWLDACIHAREWIACSTACFVIKQLVGEYRSKHHVTTQLLEKFDFYVMPCANPDGYEYSRTEWRFWRKNRSPTSDPECEGVDLNRNFDYKWNTSGTSGDPCSMIYSGTKPFSELESQAISQFITENSERILCYISFHAYGQYFLYPWGWTKENSRDHLKMREKAVKATKALTSLYKTKYTIGSPARVLYEASGGSDDWAYGAINVKYSYTIELRDDGKHGFLLPPSMIIPTGKETYLAIRTLAQELSQEI